MLNNHSENVTSVTSVSILSLDVWGNADDGFEWNNWHKIGEIPLAILDKPEPEILAWLVSEGFLTTDDPSLVTVEDDQYNLLICDASDGDRPIFALAYGEVQ